MLSLVSVPDVTLNFFNVFVGPLQRSVVFAVRYVDSSVLS